MSTRQGCSVGVIDLCCSSEEEEEKQHSSSLEPSSKRRRLNQRHNDKTAPEKKYSEVDSNVDGAKPTQLSSVVSASSAADEDIDNRLVFLSNEDGSDNCTVTSGIGEILQNLTNISSCCAGMKQTHRSATCSCRHNTRSALRLYHIQQQDKWSCGFRNLQMIQMALVPLLPSGHSYNQYANASSSSTGASIEIPSLRQLQQNMEAAWRTGFDPAGAQHYRHKIVGKKVWIGAVEVSNLFSFMGLDSTVVQFIKCPASRRLLLPFCRAYFSCHSDETSSTTRCCCCCCCCSSIPAKASSLTIAQNTLQRSEQRAPMVGCQCARLPLYLQWRGHSVTVVGVMNASSSSELLVLDPAKKGTSLNRAFDWDSSGAFRLKSKKLEKEDCQIVLVSPRSLSSSDRERMRKKVQSLTAAEMDVLQVK